MVHIIQTAFGFPANSSFPGATMGKMTHITDAQPRNTSPGISGIWHFTNLK